MSKNNVSIKITADSKNAQLNIVQAGNSISKMSNKAKAAEKEINALNKSTKNLTGGLSSLTAGINKLDFSSISNGISSINGNIGAVLPNLGKLATSILNPFTIGATAIIGAGKALFDYNSELDRSLQKTQLFTGLSGDELLSLRSGIKAVADTFGKDYDSVLGSVDGLMSLFGISGEEALQTIKKGFLGGCDDAGKFQDLISKYAGSFHDAGISANELVAIIGNTRSGIFSEEGMDLIQKGAGNIREWSKTLQQSLKAAGINADEMYKQLQSGLITTVQAIQQISTKLKSLSPQSQEVGDVLKQVFGKAGKAAGYELVTALADVETNIDNIKNLTGEWGEAMGNLADAQREFESALASLFGSSSKGFSTMTTQLKADVYGAVARVINGFIDWYNNSLLVRTGVQAIVGAFKNAWAIIKGILSLLIDAVKGTAEVVEGLFTLDWDKVKNGWTNGAKAILKDVADMCTDIGENYADAIDNIANGKIKKIEVPVEVTETTNKNTNINTLNQTNKEINTTNTVTTKVVADEGSIKALENRLAKLNEELNNKNVSDDRLKEIIKEKSEIEKQIAALKKRNGLLNNTNFAEGSLSDIQSKISSLETLIKTGVYLDGYDLDKCKAEIKRYKELAEKEQIRLGLKVVPAEGSLQDIQSKISSLETQIKTGIYLEGYDLNRCQAEIKEWKKRQEEEEIRIGLKVDDTNLSIKLPKVENKVIEKGSKEDKQQSLQNANLIAQNTQQLVYEGIISPDEGKKIIDDLNKQLEGLGLQPISLVLDTKEAVEKLQETLKQMDLVKDATGSVGNVFNNLGSAIGGVAGDFMSFAGTAIQNIGLMIPQIVSLIGASQAQAISTGTAMAAALPFPLNLGAIASIVALLTSTFAALPSFASGGIIQGTTTMGDYNLARVNGNEMILNTRQQGNLFRLLNSGTGLAGNNQKSDVNFKITGTNLVGTLKNYNKRISKLRG